jgi:hypothetical protein
MYTCIGIVPGLVLMLSEREREREELGGLGGFWQLLCEENFKMLKSLMIKKNKSI